MLRGTWVCVGPVLAWLPYHRRNAVLPLHAKHMLESASM